MKNNLLNSKKLNYKKWLINIISDLQSSIFSKNDRITVFNAKKSNYFSILSKKSNKIKIILKQIKSSKSIIQKKFNRINNKHPKIKISYQKLKNIK